MSYRSVLNASNGGPSNPKLTLKINSLRTKRKAQNFASWMLSEYAFKIGRKKGNDFLIIVHFKHPPPGPLTSFAVREGGNLMNLVFPGTGHLITTHRGWGIWSLASISCYVALIPRGVINHGGDTPWCIQSERYPIRGGLAEKQRVAQALFCQIWRYSRTIYIIFGM